MTRIPALPGLTAAAFLLSVILAPAASAAPPGDEESPRPQRIRRAAPPPPSPPLAPEEAEEAAGRAAADIERGMRRHGAGWLGVRIEELKEDSTAAAPDGHGARIAGVEEDAPAARAGLQEGDLIVSYQGERVESAMALRRMVRETPAGRTVRLGVRRGDALRQVEVKLEARRPRLLSGAGEGELDSLVEPPEPPDLPDPEELQGQIEQQFGHPGMWRWRQAFAGGPRLGVQVETLTDQLAAFFGVKGGEGILIQRVRPKSPAEKAGLKAGDVIVRAGDRKLADVDELMEALQETEENSLTLTIVRDRSEKTVPVELDSPERARGARGARRDRL